MLRVRMLGKAPNNLTAPHPPPSPQTLPECLAGDFLIKGLERSEMLWRVLGLGAGFYVADSFFHLVDAFAMGLKAETMGGRVGAVGVGVVILLALMALVRKVFAPAFFYGFVVASGLFLSFDIVVFHWVFGLHRITNGPEADWLEPIFVVFGTLLIVYGVRRELRKS